MSDHSYPVNIGNPSELDVIGIAEKIISITSSSSELVYRPLPEDDPKVRQPDISKARSVLGWEPQVSLDEGLERTIKWFKKTAG